MKLNPGGAKVKPTTLQAKKKKKVAALTGISASPISAVFPVRIDTF